MSHEPTTNREVDPTAEPLTGIHSMDIAWVGAITTVLVIVIIVATQAWFYGIEADRERRVWLDAERSGRTALSQYNAEQERLLATPRWINQDSGVAAIPIDRAMDLLVERGLQSQ